MPIAINSLCAHYRMLFSTLAIMALVAVAVLLAPGSLGAQTRSAPGSLDTGFDDDGIATAAIGSSSEARAVAVQSDGKIVVAGQSGNDIAVARFTADGALDATFGDDGKIITDIGSGSDDSGKAMAVQSDGKIVVAGSSGDDFLAVRYTADGALDATFSGDGKVTADISSGSIDRGEAVAVQSDGKIVVAGYSWIGSDFDVSVARFTADGALDATFSGDGIAITDISPGTGNDRGYSVAVQPDGKIVVAGRSNASGLDDFMVVRYTAAGALDATFNGDGIVTTSVHSLSNDYGEAVALQPDGKIVVAGYSFKDIVVARYTADGALDPAFNRGRVVYDTVGVKSEDLVRAVALESDGKIVVAGRSDNSILMARYTVDGWRDTTFGSDGLVTTGIRSAQDLVLQSDGKIVVAGSGGGGFAVARYHGGTHVGGL